MGKCPDINPKKPDFKNPSSILSALLALFKLPTGIPQNPYMAKQLILASGARPGLSPSKIAAKIIQRQSDAGIPVGALPSGSISPGEIMERVRIEEIIGAIATDMIIDVAINPGTQLTGTGGNAGGPIQVLGFLTGTGGGKAVAH
jgi:hypothetical protein